MVYALTCRRGYNQPNVFKVLYSANVLQCKLDEVNARADSRPYVNSKSVNLNKQKLTSSYKTVSWWADSKGWGKEFVRRIVQTQIHKTFCTTVLWFVRKEFALMTGSMAASRWRWWKDVQMSSFFTKLWLLPATDLALVQLFADELAFWWSIRTLGHVLRRLHRAGDGIFVMSVQLGKRIPTGPGEDKCCLTSCGYCSCKLGCLGCCAFFFFLCCCMRIILSLVQCARFVVKQKHGVQ